MGRRTRSATSSPNQMNFSNACSPAQRAAQQPSRLLDALECCSGLPTVCRVTPRLYRRVDTHPLETHRSRVPRPAQDETLIACGSSQGTGTLVTASVRTESGIACAWDPPAAHARSGSSPGARSPDGRDGRLPTPWHIRNHSSAPAHLSSVSSTTRPISRERHSPAQRHAKSSLPSRSYGRTVSNSPMLALFVVRK